MRSWGLTPTGGPQKLRAGGRSRQDDEWPRVLPGSEVSFWPGSRGGYPKTDGPVSPPADKSITTDPLASLWLFICPVYPAHYDMRSLKAGFSFLVQHLISSTKDSSFNRQYVLDSW